MCYAVHDPQEFLQFLLEGLIEELEGITKQMYAYTKTNDK